MAEEALVPNGDIRIRAREGNLVAEVREQLVILNVSSGRYFGLNEVGARIWPLIQAPISLSRIVDALLAEYEVSREQLQSDIRELVADLRRAELVDIVEAELRPT